MNSNARLKNSDAAKLREILTPIFWKRQNHLSLRRYEWQSCRTGLSSQIRNMTGQSFISQFSIHKIHQKPARHLYTITQRENETTESYLTRFVKEEMNVQDRSDAAANGALMVGLRNSTVLKYLVSVGKPDTAEHRGIFNYPPGIRTPGNKKDNTKYCRFHRDTGHTTEECRVLKDEVERLIQRGQLREYVRGANQQPRQPAQPVARPQPQDNHDLEVRTIMGGPATGETNRARKNYARQSRTNPFPHQVNLTGHKEKIPRLSDDPIVFTESEARGLWHPHTDAIVVTLRIAGRKVFRIVVDNRSSADILFKSTFNKMNLVGVKIEPTASSLSGFTGDSISS
ncbi:hypothetical protein UlMin_038776 [Ulmus minor]